jgi:hypothetical protein
MTSKAVYRTVFWGRLFLKNRSFPSFLHTWESKWVEVRVLGGGHEGVYLCICPDMGKPPTKEYSLVSARVVYSLSSSNASFHKFYLTLQSGKKLGLKTQDGGDLLVLVKALRESGGEVNLEVEGLEGAGSEAKGSSADGMVTPPTKEARRAAGRQPDFQCS